MSTSAVRSKDERASRSTTNSSQILKVILLGDGGVGKSSLMNMFVHRCFDEKSFHTIGVEFLIKDVVIDKETYALQIWDTAGQERFKSLRTPFYRGADCCLLTFALNDRESFENLSHWKQEFLYYSDVNKTERFPFVVLGNKSDIVGEEVRGGSDEVGGEGSEDRLVSREEASEWCVANGDIPYYETSAKDAVNVDVAFEAVARQVKELNRERDASAGEIRVGAINLSAGGRRRRQNDPNNVANTCC